MSLSVSPVASIAETKAIGKPVALEASADERDVRGLISITIILPDPKAFIIFYVLYEALAVPGILLYEMYPDSIIVKIINRCFALSYLSLEDRALIEKYGKAAAKTIEETWNAQVAARELVRFCREFFENGNPEPSAEGPVSTAGVIKAPGMKRTLAEKNHLE